MFYFSMVQQSKLSTKALSSNLCTKRLSDQSQNVTRQRQTFEGTRIINLKEVILCDKLMKLSNIQLAFCFCLMIGLLSISLWSSFSLLEMNAFQTTTRQKRKALLIVTYHRSGSSFVGQYFNQRNDTFYIFEPLFQFDDGCTEGSNERRQVAHLRNLFKCKMQSPHQFSKKLGTLHNKTIQARLRRECYKQNFCFRTKTKALCTREFCENKNITNCHYCKPVSLKQASQICSQADIVVIKVIRLCNIENLRPLLEDLSMDMKILELVRDPRGVYSSRKSLRTTGLGKHTFDSCNSIDHNWKYAKQKHQWMKNKYKLVRYEDVCQHPLEMGHQIYRFSGLSMTSQMKEWIIANTQGNLSYPMDGSARTILQRFQKARERQIRLATENGAKKLELLRQRLNNYYYKQIKRTILTNPYTTIRKSRITWIKWSMLLDYSNVAVVQKVCSVMMSNFNYLPIANQKELTRVSTEDASAALKSFCPRNNLALYEPSDCQE